MNVIDLNFEPKTIGGIKPSVTAALKDSLRAGNRAGKREIHRKSQ
jgi:hypothetical protein